MSPVARKILTVALLVVGVQLALMMDPTLRLVQASVVAGALLLACVPWVNRHVLRLIQRVRRVSPRTRAVTTLAVFVVSFGYLVFTALHQKRDLFPKYHDNQSYAIQARIIAAGRLWLPAHEHPDFFDTFHVIVEPVYASMYFPGAAMLFAVGVLLHLPFWITGVTIAAGCMAMLYRVIAEVVDNFAGLLAPLWLVSLIWFRHLSAMLMSHTVLLLLGLLMFWAFLRWRKSHRLRWALAVGLFAGWAALTRPADALCYALPVGIAMLWDLRRCAWGDRFRLAGTIVAGAAPFLALQVIFNVGVTGKPFESPYRFYLDRDAPQLSFGFHEYDPSKLPKSRLIQKNLYHVTYNGRLIRDHRPEQLLETWFDPKLGRLAQIAEATTPALILMPILLVGFLGLTTAPRRALFVILPLYCLLYLFYAALLRHYTPAIAPATIVLGLLGMRQIEIAWPRLRAAGTTFGLALVVGTCVIALPEVNPRHEDDPFPYPEMVDARGSLIPQNAGRPALVFVTFSLDVNEIDADRVAVKENVHSEPVYNYDAARIDDNPIVFAHDLGERNVELLRYYNERQPERFVYRYDRLARKLIPHGTVSSELQRLETLRAAQPPTSQPAPASR
ncbi:MAG: glycosyltransferase family 39 protein [Planctomycetota bacterium]|nr:glycosyltransferase family 39 protein [Planctomycetota bacterium]